MAVTVMSGVTETFYFLVRVVSHNVSVQTLCQNRYLSKKKPNIM